MAQRLEIQHDTGLWHGCTFHCMLCCAVCKGDTSSKPRTTMSRTQVTYGRAAARVRSFLGLKVSPKISPHVPLPLHSNNTSGFSSLQARVLLRPATNQGLYRPENPFRFLHHFNQFKGNLGIDLEMRRAWMTRRLVEVVTKPKTVDSETPPRNPRPW